jgi:hypothetical protein
MVVGGGGLEPRRPFHLGFEAAASWQPSSRYWLAVRPGSGIIPRLWLRAAEKRDQA